MSVKGGRYVVKRAGVVVDADASWSHGPGVSSSGIQGAEATVTWHRAQSVEAVDADHEDDNPDGDDLTVDWVDEDGTTRVYTGIIDSTSGESLANTVSRALDGTRGLERRLDLRPIAATMPIHPDFWSDGGRLRYVGLYGTWFTHQAMVAGGFDPGVPMHWSTVWYQSMCGSIATVPDYRYHAYASLGELRQASNVALTGLPTFLQGDTQIVAADVFAFGQTAKPREGTASLPWQITVDMGKQALDPTYGSNGEVLVRSVSTNAGVVMEWTATQVLIRRHSAAGVRTTVGTYNRTTSGIRDSRWSIVVHPSNGNITVRAGRWAGGVVGGAWEGRTVASITGSGVGLPTGANSYCSVRVTSPGVIGTVSVAKGDWNYLTNDAPAGRIMRRPSGGPSLTGWPYMRAIQAGDFLVSQANASVGMRGLGLLQWVNEMGVLVNIDFESLADLPVMHEFDTRPTEGSSLSLDRIGWATNPAGLHSAVEVHQTRTHVKRSPRPTLLLGQGDRETVEDGETFEVFLHPESDTTWLEPDLHPLMLGTPYPTPPYHSDYKNALNKHFKSIIGGHMIVTESGDPTTWLQPSHMGWGLNASGFVTGAITMLDPDTIRFSGVANLPTGRSAVMMPNPESPSIREGRKEEAMPMLRGMGRITQYRESSTIDIAGVDVRHPPYSHDCGLHVQAESGRQRVASCLYDAITNPAPIVTAQVEATGWVKIGQKVLLRERRADNTVIEVEVVVLSLSGSTVPSDDSMTIEGIVTARRLADEPDEEWELPPTDVSPVPPRDNLPPPKDGVDESTPGTPGTPPAKPSDPTMAVDASADVPVLVIGWDGDLDAGGTAIDSGFAYAEVAVGTTATPTDVVGTMRATGSTFELRYTPPTLGATYYARVRIVDRWEQAGPWSDAVSAEATPGTSNLLANPGTIVGGGGWGNYEPIMILNHPSSGTIWGAGALPIVAGPSVIGGVNRWVSCLPGDQFECEALIQYVGGTAPTTGGTLIALVARDASGATTGLYGIANLAAADIPTGNRWARVVGTGTAPAGTAEMRLEWWTDGAYSTGNLRATNFAMRALGD